MPTATLRDLNLSRRLTPFTVVIVLVVVIFFNGYIEFSKLEDGIAMDSNSYNHVFSANFAPFINFTASLQEENSNFQERVAELQQDLGNLDDGAHEDGGGVNLFNLTTEQQTSASFEDKGEAVPAEAVPAPPDVPGSDEGEQPPSTSTGTGPCASGPGGCTWDVVIVGSGIAGAVLADVYARILNKKVLVLEESAQIGGMFQDFVEGGSGIRGHKYGLHVLATQEERVWKYVQRFSGWDQYEHRVVSKVGNSYLPTPINIESIRKLNESVRTLPQFRDWIKDHIPTSRSTSQALTTEQAVINKVGSHVYQALFRDLYRDLLGQSLQSLDADLTEEVISIPAFVNSNFDDRRYPGDKFQGVPSDGWASTLNKMLQHPQIEVRVNTDYFSMKAALEGTLTFYTGKIDPYFKERGLPALAYSPITFEEVVLEQLKLDGTIGQPMLQVDHPNRTSVSITTFEYKHLHCQTSNFTVIQGMHGGKARPETDNARTVDYYLTPTPANKELLRQHKALMEEETKKNVYFLANTGFRTHHEAAAGIAAAFDVLKKVNDGVDVDSLIDASMQEAAVVNGTALAGDSRRVLRIQWVLSLYKESLDWMRDVCRWPAFNVGVEVTWLIYVKCPGRGLDAVQSEAHAALAAGGCDHERHKFEISRLENVGRESQTFFVYIMMHQFDIADVVIFTQPEMHSSLQSVSCRVVQIYRSLFLNDATKSGDLENLEKDIINWPNAEAGMNDNLIQCVRGAFPKELDQLQKDMTVDFRLHMLPLNIVQSFYLLWQAKMKPWLRLLYCDYFLKDFKLLPQWFFYKAEFVCTEAAILRMLQRHRGWLWHKLMRPLASMDIPSEIYVVEGIWWHLFHDPHVQTIDKDVENFVWWYDILFHRSKKDVLKEYGYEYVEKNETAG